MNHVYILGGLRSYIGVKDGMYRHIPAEKLGAEVYLPPLHLCGDNGAMIGAQGYYEYLAGHTAGMELNAYATRDIAD